MLLFLAGAFTGAAIGIVIIMIASGCFSRERAKETLPENVAPTAHRDPRAPAGMTDVEYRGWEDRRNIADQYITQSEARRR